MQADLVVGMMSGEVDDLSADVARIGCIFVNAYMLGKPGERWVLIDTGLPGFSQRIADAAAARWGDARPEAIVLTHAHFDHAGNVLDLADRWNVPVYVHPMELPFVTGESDYAPPDPTIGGAISFMSRFFPHGSIRLDERVRILPDDGSVPGAPDWHWIHTPGHTPGHISLFREDDRCLIAGDAFATMDLDSWSAMTTFAEEYDRPPASFTPDWDSARKSVEHLATLEPRIVGAGHGLPVYGNAATSGLHDLAAHFPVPSRGRYAERPVRYDDQGVIAVPPPVPDPLPRAVASWAAAGSALALSAARARQRRRP